MRKIIFDFETTGLDFENDRIIECALIIIEDDNIIYTFDELVDPVIDIPDFITELTRINEDEISVTGITQEDLYNELSTLIKADDLLIAYNTQFDINFLENLFKRYEPTFKLENDLLDVMAIYRDRHYYPHKLESAISKYSVSSNGSHRALNDVMNTYNVLIKMAKEKDNIKYYINRFGYNKKYGIDGKLFTQVIYIPQKGKRYEIKKKRNYFA